MSELVATSPRKLELCSQDPLEARKRSPTRPKSLMLPLTTSLLPRLSPPQRAKRQSHIGSVSSLAVELDACRDKDLGSPITMRGNRRCSPARRGSDTSTEESAVTDEAESTFVSLKILGSRAAGLLSIEDVDFEIIFRTCLDLCSILPHVV